MSTSQPPTPRRTPVPRRPPPPSRDLLSGTDSDESWIDAVAGLSLSRGPSGGTRGNQPQRQPVQPTSGGVFSSSESEGEYGTASVIAARTPRNGGTPRPASAVVVPLAEGQRGASTPGELVDTRNTRQSRARRARRSAARSESGVSSSSSAASSPPLGGEEWGSFTATSIHTEEFSSFSESVDLMSMSFTSARSRQLIDEDDEDETSSLSLSSLEDAASEIDNFLSDSDSYTSVPGNKLRFWQALCLELGLATPPPTFNLSDPFSIGPSDTHPSPPSSTPSTPRATAFALPSRSPTPTNPRVELPQTLTGCRKLLKDRGHVNLVDYWAARVKVQRMKTEAEREGQMEGLEKRVRKVYGSLVWGSAGAMIRYTVRNKKIAKKQVVKSEWLDPLMRTLSHR